MDSTDKRPPCNPADARAFAVGLCQAMNLPRGTERLVIVCDVHESVIRVYAKGFYLSQTVGDWLVEGVKDMMVSNDGEVTVVPFEKG